MYVNGIQCDTCTKINNANMSLLSHGDMPQGWISTKMGKGDLMHFCSIHCLGDWVQKLILIPVEVKQVENADRLELWKEITVVRAEVAEKKDEYWRDL